MKNLTEESPAVAESADTPPPDHGRRRHGRVWLAILSLVSLGGSIFVVWAGVCTPQPCLSRMSREQRRSDRIAAFINNCTLTGRIIQAPAVDDTNATQRLPAEELALKWLILQDPLQLQPDSPANQSRLLQRYALQTMRVQRKSDPFHNPAGDTYGAGPDECQWLDVACGNQNSTHNATVTEINVLERFKGTLSPDLGLLTELVRFYFASNKLMGTLPVSIGQWTRLESFHVGLNQLNGTLPDSMAAWTNLERFLVHNNELSGTVPYILANRWTNLNEASFESNDLTGDIPCFRGGGRFSLKADCASDDIQCPCCTSCS